jgi:hypothetical protein
MNRGLVFVVCVLAILWSMACDSKKETVQIAAEDDGTPKAEESFAGIEASQTQAENMGEASKPLFFRSVSIEHELTPGTLPPVPGSKFEDESADQSIRRIVYATRAGEEISRIDGFAIVKPPAQREIEGFAPKALTRIRVTLEYGPVDKIRFGVQGPPPIPDKPPVIGEQPSEQETEIAADGAELPKNDGPVAPQEAAPTEAVKEALPAEAVAKSQGLTRVFERDFLLSDSGKPQYWEFSEPYAVEIPFGAGIQATVEYLVPELYPTLDIIAPGDIQIAIPDRYREQSEPRALSPVIEKRPSVCMASPRGQLVCLYSSRVAELYVQSPFEKVALVGSWTLNENTLSIETAEQTWTFDVTDPAALLDFGVYGDGYKMLAEGDDRLHPYYDLARELGGDEPFKPEKIRYVYHVQMDQQEESEAVAEFVGGGFAVYNRADAFSPYRLMTRVDLINNRLQVVTVPMTDRGFVAVKSEADENWTVYAYDPVSNSFVTFLRKTVPWKTWEPGVQKESAPIRRELPENDGQTEPPKTDAAPAPNDAPEPDDAAPAAP